MIITVERCIYCKKTEDIHTFIDYTNGDSCYVCIFCEDKACDDTLSCSDIRRNDDLPSS